MNDESEAKGLWDDAEVVHEYPDSQAVEDGVLVPWPFAGSSRDRITRAVFYEYARRDEETGRWFVEPLVHLWVRVAGWPADDMGWRTGEDDGTRLWMVPNEIGGHTLMFPSDW